ncbi:hypothetical protein, partial [Psychrobacter sanguinis]|uniref:hypothetical protein n=1 Tax=Psychrobacter sanguinis TaxID=861445 RepID=UPI0036292339
CVRVLCCHVSVHDYLFMDTISHFLIEKKMGWSDAYYLDYTQVLQKNRNYKKTVQLLYQQELSGFLLL